MRTGGTRAEASQWQSETSVRGMLASAHGGTRRVTVTTQVLPGSLSEVFSFSCPSVSVLEIANAAGTGSLSLTVHGSGLAGTASSVRVTSGETSCEATAWQSQSSVTCFVASGLSRSSRVGITASSSIGTLSAVVSFDSPRMSQLRFANLPATGSTSVTVLASSFGAAEYTVSGRQMFSSCEATLWLSDSSLRYMVPGGEGRRSLGIFITAGLSTGSQSDVASYSRPEVSSMFGTNRASKASVSVTLRGSTFAAGSYSVTARVGLSACEASTWHSDTEMASLSPVASGSTRRISVTAGIHDGTTSGFISYNKAVLSQLFPSNQAGTGSTSITALGGSFSLFEVSATVRLGQTS
eukprot:1910978-Rhodomonas_salina.1